MEEKFFLVGLALILLGFFILLIASFMTLQKHKANVEIGIGGFIGPIPFGFFTSKRMFWIWLVLMLLLLIIFLILKRSF